MEWNKNLEPETEGWYVGSFHLRNKDETAPLYRAKGIDGYFWDYTTTEFTPTYGLVTIQPFPKPIDLNTEDDF